MAILKLTIHDVKISKDVNSQVENDLVLSTEQKADSRGTLVLVKKDVELTSKDDKKRIYSLTLQNLEFTKKMYQPTTLGIALDGLVERFRFHAIQRGDISVEQHLLIADREHAGLNGGDVYRPESS